MPLREHEESFTGGVDVVMNGHDHLYERFEPMDPMGRRDPPTTGIREYVVGLCH